jgi:hypothetical protein
MKLLFAAIAALVLCALLSTAHAGVVRVDVECEQSGRTKACPAFLLGFLDANKVFINSPRADADVVLHVSSVDFALIDRVHLRFVSAMKGAPELIELDADLDTRTDDDTQRAVLERAFVRGIALYVAVREPELVTVSLASAATTHAAAAAAAAAITSPWDFSLSVNGSGSWTGPYQSGNGSLGGSISRTTTKMRGSFSASAAGGVNKQPPLKLDDGTTISISTSPWSLTAGGGAAYLFNDHWSVSGGTSASRSDPHSQNRTSYSGSSGVEWDKYLPNDPRGNRLSVSYSASYELDHLNLRNELGETTTHYPSHSLGASGSVRKDKTDYSLSLSVGSEMFHPERRYQLSASPSVTWQLGGHVDVSASFSIEQRRVVAPDPSAINTMDYAEVSQLSYTQPFSVSGSLGFTFHWDRTNGARNDR